MSGEPHGRECIESHHNALGHAARLIMLAQCTARAMAAAMLDHRQLLLPQEMAR